MNYDFERLAEKMIFGTDWPGAPGPRKNAEAIASLGLERETPEGVLHKTPRPSTISGRHEPAIKPPADTAQSLETCDAVHLTLTDWSVLIKGKARKEREHDGGNRRDTP